MIIIINGPNGIGKTSTAWELNARFDRAVMLDGDHVGAVHPFEIYDDARIDYLYRTLTHLIAFHQREGGYENFVINYVFESPESLEDLRRRLRPLDDRIYTFRLVADEAAIEARILARDTGADAAWHLDRFRELLAIQEAAARRGDVGEVLDTTALSVVEVVDVIWRRAHESVQVAEYDPAWPVAFERERVRVAAALGARALAIHHVGSTAVPGLAAKPIIDLLVEVARLDDALDCIAPLAALGYAFIDHPENVERRFFRKGIPRTHHLHIVERGSDTAGEHLAFRDALRADPARREAYAQLKRALAERHPNDRRAYTRGKAEFIAEVLREVRG